MRRPLIVLAVLLLVPLAVHLGDRALAQEKPAPPAAASQPAPELPAEAREALLEMRQRLAAIRYMQALAQREQDIVLAELQRFVRDHQVPGYQLDLATGKYVSTK